MKAAVEKPASKVKPSEGSKKKGKRQPRKLKSYEELRKEIVSLKPSKFGTIRYGHYKKQIIKHVLRPRIRKSRIIKRTPKGKKPAPATKKAVKPAEGKPAEGKAAEGKPAEGKAAEGKTKDGEAKPARRVGKKLPSYYPVLQTTKRKRRHRKTLAIPRLKKTLTPGTVCILVAGLQKGKRVVFLKQLKSGLCLITGPFSLNKCPLRRANQNYLIGTSTKIELPKDFVVPEHINDAYFKRVSLKKTKKEGDIFASKPQKYVVTAARRKDQYNVDKAVIAGIKKHKERRNLSSYLCHKFSLKNHQFPHKLKF